MTAAADGARLSLDHVGIAVPDLDQARGIS